MNLPLFATGRVSSTKERIPFELVYYEACLKEQGALAREKYLKSGMGQRYSKNRLKRFLSLTGQVEEAKVPYITRMKRKS
jgi:predicted GIY-YIG superfamily endonuclease